MHEESIKELATRVCIICNKPIGSNESDIEKYLENSVHVACFYESDILQNETIQKIAVDAEAEVSQVTKAWTKWADSQMGDWRDVSHSESFYAGYEACQAEKSMPEDVLEILLHQISVIQLSKRTSIVERRSGKAHLEINGDDIHCSKDWNVQSVMECFETYLNYPRGK